MSQVIVFPRGQLSAKDKERMTKAGIIAVEADEPSRVVQLMPSSALVSGDDLLMAAFAGLTCEYASSRETAFVHSLNKRLKAREQALLSDAKSAGSAQ